MPKISIVVPCYNEQAALPLFYQEITRVASEMDYAEFEFVFIDDGSKDDTLPTPVSYTHLDVYKRQRLS